MIVVDTSALIAVLEREPERDRFLEILSTSDRVCLSALIYYETLLVASSRRGAEGITDLDEMLATVGAEIISFDADHARSARAAYAVYGKGNHSGARLNLCDCASYALSKTLGAALLFKGADLSSTDVASATSP